jgi:poly(3-hydroxybutyrate) depolymerase
VHSSAVKRGSASRIFITGLSAGGAMASVLLSTYPEVFAGGAIIAGLPFGSANTMPQAFDRMRGHGSPAAQQLGLAIRQASAHSGPWPKISVWHGSADVTVSPVNAEQTVDQWLLVHGLARKPQREKSGDGYKRRVWQTTVGEEIVETYIVDGMGHGTPVDARDGLSNAGPFMLDVGISSTIRIARFWCIADGATLRDHHETSPRTISLGRSDDARHANLRPSGGRTTGPQQVIEDALRAAGLMK